MIAKTPIPPYYAVIFSSVKTGDDAGYGEMAELMMDLASKQEGFLGVESARNELGITVSYWTDLAAIRNWKLHADHQLAQKMGRSDRKS
ncbi:MAG: antibiotic biosynthesis monooxygenase, partial [Bacteroidota bacterium]